MQEAMTQALKEGTDKRVDFGRLSDRNKYKINNQFQKQGDEKMIDKNVYVYPAVIKKLQQSKLTQHLSPETLSDIAYSIVHGDSHALPGRYPNTVKLVKPKANKGYNNTGIIGEFESSGSLKSVFPDNPRKKKLSGGDGK